MIPQNYIWQSYFGDISIGVWKDETYFAAAFQRPECVWLVVHRNDAKDGITWDEMQRIKGACGFSEYDGIEFYPKDSDVVNTGNCRHLQLFRERLPLIWRLNGDRT